MSNAQSLRLSLLLAVAVFALAHVSRGQFGGGSTPQPQAQPKPPVVATVSKPIKPIKPGSVSSPANVYFPAPSEREEALFDKLNETDAWDFADTPLTDVLTAVAERLSVKVLLDHAGLSEAGIAADTPITFQIPAGQLTTQAALQQMLRPIQLTVFTTDGILTVTTTSRWSESLFTRAYPVGDLIDPERIETYEELVNLLTTTTTGPWLAADGDGGTLAVSHTTRAVAIKTDRRNHDEIVELLTALRAARDVE